MLDEARDARLQVQGEVDEGHEGLGALEVVEHRVRDLSDRDAEVDAGGHGMGGAAQRGAGGGADEGGPGALAHHVAEAHVQHAAGHLVVVEVAAHGHRGQAQPVHVPLADTDRARGEERGLDPARLLHLRGGDELALGPRREVLERLALLGGELAGASVEDAEGGHRGAGVVAQRHADVGADAVADDGQVAEPVVLGCVGHLEGADALGTLDGGAAERLVLGHGHGVEPVGAGEPRPTVVQHGHGRHRHVQGEAGKPGDAVQARVAAGLGQPETVHGTLSPQVLGRTHVGGLLVMQSGG